MVRTPKEGEQVFKQKGRAPFSASVWHLRDNGSAVSAAAESGTALPSVHSRCSGNAAAVTLSVCFCLRIYYTSPFGKCKHLPSRFCYPLLQGAVER